MEVGIFNYTIHTCQGKSEDWGKIPNLTTADMNMLNQIGYGAEKRYGPGAKGMETFLNALLPSNTHFAVQQIEYDNGNFMEKFLVTQVVIPPIEVGITM